jgi:hypothetical protein
MIDSVWEDTVVTAIRDEKWLHALRHGDGRAIELPALHLRFKHTAEQRLGDLLDKTNGDRFFLIEVKGTRDKIEAEWNTKNARNEHQKLALREIRKWFGSSSAKLENDLLELSVRGHHFAYWWGHPVDTEFSSSSDEEKILSELLRKEGCVVIEPYALACARLMRSFEGGIMGVTPLLDRFALAYAQSGSREKSVVEQIPLSVVYEARAQLIELDHGAPSVTAKKVSALGLTLDEMQRYVNALCARPGVNDEPIIAVLMSTSGNFFRISTTTSNLKLLVSQTEKPTQESFLHTKTIDPVFSMTKAEKDTWKKLVDKDQNENTFNGARKAVTLARRLRPGS